MNPWMRRLALTWVCAGAILAVTPLGAAQGDASGNQQTLPYRPPQTDAFGNRWSIYSAGVFHQIGEKSVYGEGAVLTVNGNRPTMNGNTARIDNNGELVFENMQAGSFIVTRRLWVNKEKGYLRIIDIIKNPQLQDQQVNLGYRSTISNGLQDLQKITDDRNKGQVLSVIAQDGQGCSVVEIYGGRGAKQVPEITATDNDVNIRAQMPLTTIKAGKEIALLHVHYIAASNEAGIKFVSDLQDNQLLKNVPNAVRRLICNFVSPNVFVGNDLQLLRGDAYDVIELRDGDSVKGTLKVISWKLNTFYGPMELAADHVVAMVNVGDARPRQLLVTDDGEIYGGTLADKTISLELSSGQVVKAPLSQITRIGYRNRVSKSEESTLDDKSFISLRSGERIAVDLPLTDVEIATRYGLLKLKSQTISSIVLANDEGGSPTITLIDGSHFTGLVVQPFFEMKPSNTAGNPVVRFPTSSIACLQWANKMDDSDNNSATFKLIGDDVMVGRLIGNYTLDVAFDTVVITGAQVKKIAQSQTVPSDAQITLWDDTSASGQLQEQALNCQLKSGLAMKIPLGLLNEYVQPQPAPSDAIARLVTEIVVKRLGGDDWKDRDAAQTQLVAMGPAIAPLLKDLRPTQNPEGQQRIDAILAGFKGNPGGNKNPAPLNAEPMNLDNQQMNEGG